MFCKCFNKIFFGVIKMVCKIVKLIFVFVNIKSIMSYYDIILMKIFLIYFNMLGFRIFRWYWVLGEYFFFKYFDIKKMDEI